MSQSVFSDVGRVIAVGDLHGNIAGFKEILRRTGIIDVHGDWIARDTHLVQLGDILGRGGEPGKIFRLLQRLEEQAPAFGSHVHVLLGNHEAMSMTGLLLYNTMEEFHDMAAEDWLPPDASPGKPPESGDWTPARDSKLGKRLDMMGCGGFRASLSPGGKAGGWLARHDSAVAINGYLFVHGGLNREHGCMELEALNERVRRELIAACAPDAGKDIMLRRDGPQWNREFTLRPTAARKSELKEVLDYHGCSHMVVGHTPTSCIDPASKGRIATMYGRRLFCIDTGIGKTYGGNLSALSLEKGVASALHF